MTDVYDEEYDGDFEPCEECGGEGVIITCCDDICVGQGWCMHGDGEIICPVCGGEGEIFIPISGRENR